MDWYVVVKTIRGRRYYYRQKTWRDAGPPCGVKCRSIYLRPYDGSLRLVSATAVPLTVDWTGAVTLPPPEQTLTIPKFQPGITADTCQALTRIDASAVGWEHHWTRERNDENLVALDNRVSGLLKSHGVIQSDETTGAYYRPSLDIVNIPPQACFKSMNGQTATSAYHVVLFHELVHWTKRRVDRRGVAAKRMSYAREELVAELGAVMLMEHFGFEIGNKARHAKYFQGWLSAAGSERVAVNYARREAERAVKYLLEHGKVG